LQEIGNVRPGYTESFAAAQAKPVPIGPLAALDAPLLVGRGEFDHVADPAEYQRLRTVMPGASFIVLLGCGHSPYFEQPEMWNKAVLCHVENGLAGADRRRRSAGLGPAAAVQFGGSTG
jgi:pimeloyl-ACP methyl ester carboxylesterase